MFKQARNSLSTTFSVPSLRVKVKSYALRVCMYLYACRHPRRYVHKFLAITLATCCGFINIKHSNRHAHTSSFDAVFQAVSSWQDSMFHNVGGKNPPVQHAEQRIFLLKHMYTGQQLLAKPRFGVPGLLVKAIRPKGQLATQRLVSRTRAGLAKSAQARAITMQADKVG